MDSQREKFTSSEMHAILKQLNEDMAKALSDVRFIREKLGAPPPKVAPPTKLNNGLASLQAQIAVWEAKAKRSKPKLETSIPMVVEKLPTIETASKPSNDGQETKGSTSISNLSTQFGQIVCLESNDEGHMIRKCPHETTIIDNQPGQYDSYIIHDDKPCIKVANKHESSLSISLRDHEFQEGDWKRDPLTEYAHIEVQKEV